jgi:ribosomal protein L11 methyltransferase
MDITFYTRLRVTCTAEQAELLMAEISEVGFDSFLETEDGFEAYAVMETFDRKLIEEILEDYQSRPGSSITTHIDKIPRENWNEQWEKDYEPIVVDDKCLIRAEFHRLNHSYPYELIITPKMSFGTGHHQTTYLMIKTQLALNHVGKRVMDAGCGTAILSVMASKLGAASVEAFDIDDWSVSNGRENIEINGCKNITHHQGKLAELGLTGQFDIILANINKNVLLEELPHYARYLSPHGVLVMSGFFSSDIRDLLEVDTSPKLRETGRDEREEWASLILTPVWDDLSFRAPL